MKGLLKKDYILLKNYLVMLLLFDVFMSLTIGLTILKSQPDKCVSDVRGVVIMTYVIVVIVQALINQSINDDEKSGFLANAFTQPVTRGEYVKAKYILALQITGIFAGIVTAGIIIGIIFRKEPFPSEALVLLVKILVLTLAGALSISFNSISLFMKFGAGKKGGGVGVIVLSPMMITYYIWALNVTRDKSELNILVPAIVTLLSFAVSLFLVPMSFKWAERREV